MERLRPDHIDQLDFEWLLLGALREAFSIARDQNVTYLETVAIAKVVAPKLIEDDSPLVASIEADLHRLYRELAAVRTNVTGQEVRAVDLLSNDVAELEENVRRAKKGDDSRAMSSHLARLRRALETIEESRWTESQAIRRDSDAICRVLPVSGNGQDYKDFQVTKARRLRVRVLHPDPGEWRSGVDLIYEEYKGSDQRPAQKAPGVADLSVRLAALMYKMWDGSSLLTSQDDRIVLQMDRARSTFCANGLCKPADPPAPFRLPWCAAFLRPTGRTQSRRGYQATRAWHVPICVARESFTPTRGGEKISAESIAEASVTQEVFHNLFHRNMLGTRWLPASELEAVYAASNILLDVPRVVVHAQEYGR